MTMRFALILLVSSVAAAQARGTPASVGSPTPTSRGGMVIHGVPAGATSLGPQGFTPQINPLFPDQERLLNPLAPRPRRHFNGSTVRPVPVYVPVYYPYTGYVNYDEYSAQPQERVVERVIEKEIPPQRVEIVLVDKRGEDKRPVEPEPAVELPKQSNLSEPPDVPAIFIFRDGSRKELTNFAVMAGNLYDLSAGRMRRIALNTIDRDATLAANARAGREIQLP